MLFWRISKYRDLRGSGAEISSGCWNIPGPRMVYMAENPAGALLEICAHTPAESVPKSYTLLKIVAPDVPSEEIGMAALPTDWTQKPEITQQIGADWLKSQNTAILRVPSAPVPETTNYLLNLHHPDASQFHIDRTYKYPFDLRPIS